jgi:hypothetical protein
LSCGLGRGFCVVLEVKRPAGQAFPALEGIPSKAHGGMGPVVTVHGRIPYAKSYGIAQTCSFEDD